jgi:hypothetical protein
VKITSVSKSPPPPYSKFICGIIFRCSYTLRTTPPNEIIDAAVYISTNVPKGSPKVLDQYIKKKSTGSRQFVFLEPTCIPLFRYLLMIVGPGLLVILKKGPICMVSA